MNNDRILVDCWKVMLSLDGILLQDRRLPLINLEKYIYYFNLPILPAFLASTDVIVSQSFFDVTPGFNNLTEEILVWLRSNIYLNRNLNLVEDWAEKLMRFCEIKLKILKKCALNKWCSTLSAQANILQLAALFLDYSVFAKDLRFVNIALKIVEFRWVYNKKNIINQLNSHNNIISAIFQLRIFLMLEYIIAGLDHRKPL